MQVEILAPLGKGPVTGFVGPGRLWMQTRSPRDVVSRLVPKLRPTLS